MPAQLRACQPVQPRRPALPSSRTGMSIFSCGRSFCSCSTQGQQQAAPRVSTSWHSCPPACGWLGGPWDLPDVGAAVAPQPLASKQKHWILLKYWPACCGATL